MTNGLLLDTHIALWLDSGDERLRPPTRDLISRTWSAGENLYLSAISAWEIALLVDTGRIALDLAPAAWVERFVSRAGVEAATLSCRTAARACAWPALEHREPADRLLVATAIELGCPLVTYDTRIADFAERHGEGLGFLALTA